MKKRLLERGSGRGNEERGRFIREGEDGYSTIRVVMVRG